MNESAKNSTFSTLALLVFKEIRLERGIHQGVMAQAIGKTPSAWTKIENGQSPLGVDVFMGACSALQLVPSYVMGLIERLVSAFNAHGFYFHTQALADGEDDLLPMVLEYFNSAGYEALRSRMMERVSVTTLGSPFTILTPSVVLYCSDANFKAWIDQGAKPAESIFNMSGMGGTPGAGISPGGGLLDSGGGF